jgi:Secreted repeat of unknown function
LGKPTERPGVNRRLVGTIAVRGVGRQVTYAGHPLYSYVGDTRPGESDNINIFQSGGYWPAIAPSGARGQVTRAGRGGLGRPLPSHGSWPRSPPSMLPFSS